MKYIITCPECGKSIRFPLDKGKIKIKCACGFSMIADPDDISLYKKGKFDPTPEQDSKKRENNSRDKKDSRGIINSLLEVKYRIQNIRYMPDRERRRVILLAVAAAHAAGAAIFFFIKM